MELQEWENTGKWQACDRIPNFTSRQENEKWSNEEIPTQQIRRNGADGCQPWRDCRAGPCPLGAGLWESGDSS
jgi:hypothetical protein